MDLLEASGLGVRHGEHTVLHGVNFRIAAGEIVTVVGPNGSGKSTLVRALIGLEPATTGTVRRADRLRIGYVPQRLKVEAGLPMTVRRFLSLPERVSDSAAADALMRVGVPGLEDRQLARLSGGQFQRVLVARAMLSRPDLLILDEATEGLAPLIAMEIWRIVKEIRKTGIATVIVDKNHGAVTSICDRAMILVKGEVVFSGTSDAIRAEPELIQKHLGV